MAKYSDDFRAVVQQVCGGLSNREIARLTDGAVSHTLIGEIKSTGYVPTVEVIVHLARAVRADPNSLLDAAGKPRYLRYVPEEAAHMRRGRAAGSRPVAARPVAA